MGFEIITLGEYAKVQGGFAYKSKDFSGSGTCKVLKIKNVRFGHVDYSDTAYISESIANDTEAWTTQEGDILISMTGSGPNAPQSLVGRVARVWKGEEKSWINQRVGRLYLKENGKIHLDFVFYLLSLPQSQDFLVSNSSGSANQANISGKTIELLPCPKVTYLESSRIADIARSLDEKIIANRQINQNLEQMAQTLFKSWFVDFDPVIDNALEAGNPIPESLQAKAEVRKAVHESNASKKQVLPDDIRQLFPSEFEESELGWIPKGWSVSDVGAEFDVTMGQSPPGSTYNELGLGIPFFQGKTDFGFRFPVNRIYCTEPKRLANKNDTLISVRAPVGDINMAADNCAIGRGLAAVRHKSGSVSFSYYAMMNLAKYFDVFEGEGTVFGSINQKDFKALPQLLFPCELMPFFDAHATFWDQKIEVLNGENKSLTKLRDTLLPKLITGELRLGDVDVKVEELEAIA